MLQQPALHDESEVTAEADRLDEIDRRNAAIASILGAAGVVIPGILLILADTAF
ncbi:hypothetical protein [Salinibacterium sp. M195]|uniref:hypothetical protein n=1 Tax=Salinibacterium sp. M195 TaxID=2583374 RepID=UPI001C62D7CB|nr:hypothetical protein [Salinibacterium sp. M195]